MFLISVSFGGTVGFFLGCSVQSVAEIVYFFTLRLLFYFCRKNRRVGRSLQDERVVAWSSPQKHHRDTGAQRRVMDIMHRSMLMKYEPTFSRGGGTNRQENSIWSLVNIRNPFAAPKRFSDLKLQPGTLKSQFHAPLRF